MFSVKNIIYRALDIHAAWRAHRQGVDEKRIAIVCRRGQNYADNPKYVVDALERLYPSTYDFVVLAFKEPENIPNYVRFIQADTRNAIRELARARLWIANTRTNWPINKSFKQIYLQTWHASMGPKLSEKRAENKFSKGYLRMAKRDGAFTDFMFANDNIHAQSFAEDYWQTGPVIRCGIPRNKPLIHYSQETAVQVRQQLGVPEGNALLLYAPTFRNEADLEKHTLNMDVCVQALQQRFKCPFSVAYRLHPEVAKIETPSYLRNCMDATHFPDTQELLCATDVLISDYSSILEDFLLLGRPCFTYAPDIENYIQERGFYYPLTDRPAPYAETEKDLLGAILAFDNEAFLTKRAAFFQQLDLTEDGNGDEVIARVIHALMPHGATIETALVQCRKDQVFSAIENQRGQSPAPKPTTAPLSV